MDSMRQQGVKRAEFSVYSRWHSGKPENLKVVRRVYFSQYDAAYSQITDAGRLEQIEKSGLQTMLDNIATAKTLAARPFEGPDGPRRKNVQRVANDIEFFV